MSIKIYEAYRYNATVNALFPAMVRYRNRVFDAAVWALGTMISADKKPRLLELSEEIKTAIRSGRNVPINLQSSIVLFCHPLIPGTVMVPFGVDHITKIAEKKISPPPGWKHFGYWDNVDPPKDVSVKEWDFRRRAWSMLEKQGGSTFAKMGLTIPIVDESTCCEIAFRICERFE